MKETKTVRVGSFLQVGDKPYFADTYVLPLDEAVKVIEAGGVEVKASAKAISEASEPKTARK